jgi:thymidylate kinase
VPRAELDLSMLAVRCLLKYRARDVIKDVLKIRSPGIPDEIRAEIAWLMRDTTDDSRSATAMMNADIVPADVIQQFVQTVAANPRDGFALLRLRTRLRRGLRDGQRRSRFSASVEYFWNVWRRRKRLRLRRFETRMTPAGGGLTVGFVGADGSGKSTITAATADWLRWKLDARVHYLGSKEPSRASRLLYVAFRALRRGHRSVLERTGSRSVAARPSAAVRDVLLAAHHLSISRDKAIRYRQARRETQGGSIAIFDRFPMEELSRHPAHRRLDGPQISAALGESMGRFTRRLASTEEQLYRTFGLPDCLFVLEVDPEIASRRKPDHDPQLIAAKARAAAELAELAELRGCAVIRLDANRPLESVLLDVKARLWDAL